MWNWIRQFLIGCCGLVLAAGACCIAAGTAVAAARTITLDSEDLTDAIWLLEDPDGTLSIDQVRSTTVRERFQPWAPRGGEVNLSFNGSAWWFRVTLQRGERAPSEWILNIPYAYNRFIDFYAPDSPAVLTGHGRPVESRPRLSQHFAFPISVEDEPREFYFRVASNYAVSLPLTAWQPGAYLRNAMHGRLLQALYHSGLLMMAVYALLIWLWSRDHRFSLFALYALLLNVSMLSGNGWGGVLLWPTRPEFDEVASGVFLSLTIAALIGLVMRVLKTEQTAPQTLNRAMRWGAVVSIIHGAVMLASIGKPGLSVWLYQTLVLLGLGALAAIGIAAWFARHHPIPGKHFFLASWLVVALGVLVASLRMFGGLPSTGLTRYAVQISTAVELVLLSFMLASIVRSERLQSLADRETLINDLRQHEQRLEQSVEARTQALVEAVQSERKTLSEFLRFSALVSHEFRNGLNVISAQSEMLRKQSNDPAVSHRSQIIGQHVARLARITNTWLKSDQILNAPTPPQIEAVDCRQLIESALDKPPEGFDLHRIEWSVGNDAATVWADRQLIEVVLVNLLSNACKYSPPGSSIIVRTRSRVSPAGVPMTGLEVADQGQGIEPALQQRIFERYFRVRPEGAVSGTGLGLSFVRHIADQHNGTVELSSEAGRGSVFTVWFPDCDSQ